ncbi:aldose 1-epimerase family protein [Arthrobacter sp. TMN-37]
MDSEVPLSGRQYTLRSGSYTAEIASVGASLRRLRFDGRDLVVPYGEDEVRPFFRGALLAPWPNRVVDARYTFGGSEHFLAHTEPNRGHALHGLLAWQDWLLEARTESSVRLSAEIVPQDGYPFRVLIHATYFLDDAGLHTTVTATNTGPSPAPYGTAPHPYLVGGTGRVDDWTLSLPADSVLNVTEDRLIPTTLDPVHEAFDFRTPRTVGTTFIDHAFTDLAYDGGGRVTVGVTGADGRGAGITFGRDCPWVQVHTADQPDPVLSRLGMAVEPMTCPPDAFNSGTDLVVLQPGGSHEAHWSIHAL